MEKFNWDEWIQKIEDAVSRNISIEIDLPQSEWERLKREKFSGLKEKLSENAVKRLNMFNFCHGDSKDKNRYFLIILRQCMCSRS